MTIEGRINVDALFHDKGGTATMRVLSLSSGSQYKTGKVAFITGTASGSQTTIPWEGTYTDSEGNVVTGSPSRALFSWSGSVPRILQLDEGSGDIFCRLPSKNNEVAAMSGFFIEARLQASSNNTGTYTLIVYVD